MGYRISWLAVQGIDKATVYDRLGFTPSGKTGFAFDHPTTGMQLSNGWTVVGFNRLAHELVDDDEVRRLSAGWTVMACNYCETTMCSTASLWKDGKEVWGVWHFSNDTVDHLETSGLLPAEFAIIEEHYRALQAQEDANETLVDHMIEIPMAIATRITSFIHNEGPADFEYLEPKHRA
jgi:hypothetical protein